MNKFFLLSKGSLHPINRGMTHNLYRNIITYLILCYISNLFFALSRYGSIYCILITPLFSDKSLKYKACALSYIFSYRYLMNIMPYILCFPSIIQNVVLLTISVSYNISYLSFTYCLFLFLLIL